MTETGSLDTTCMRSTPYLAPVVEFLGLPGAGKSTIAASLVAELRAKHVDVRTTDDFVTWLAGRSSFEKVEIVVRSLPRALTQLWRVLLFAGSLRCSNGLPMGRVAQLPFVNCCFDRYLRLHKSCVVVMDQANMQLVWSVGAYAASYKASALDRLCSAACGQAPRLYAFVAATPDLVTERIRQRPSNASRFDRESESGLRGALNASTALMKDIAHCLVRNGERVMVLDATASIESNAQALLEAVCATREELAEHSSHSGACRPC